MRGQVLFYTVLIFLLLILSDKTYSQTYVHAGKISGKWTKQNSPYFIEGEIKIPRGKKLIIEPGVQVIFNGHYKFIVNGILEARGTESDYIYFIPSDTSIGWYGLRFIDAQDKSILDFCILKYGKTNVFEKSKDFDDFSAKYPRQTDLDYNGGAILINNSNPIISNCYITNNFAYYDGGGIDIRNNSSPEILNCVFKNNVAYHDGGAIMTFDNSSPIIKNCNISENYCQNMGGAIAIFKYSNTIVDSCIISGNKSEGAGGGICFYTSRFPTIKNSVLQNNSSIMGGGIYIDEFYNDFREQPGKIDIRLTNLRIENNSADYGGGIWLRDTQGEFGGLIVCYNTANVGAGIHIEHNPMYFSFSPSNLCNIYMNFARIMGNDLFRLAGGAPIEVPLDTFTVKFYSALNAEPVEKFPISIKNFKLDQINADLYVSPDGSDSNSGVFPSEPLQSLSIALLKILADSTSPRTIYLSEGEYIFTKTNDILLLEKHKYVTLAGSGLTEVLLGTDRITVFTPWWITNWALFIYVLIFLSVISAVWNVRSRRIKMNNELERERFEAQKMHEVDEIKTRFFTNISHEFRTPLTLILGPAKQIIESVQDEKIKQQLSLIYRNGKKLLELVNQLLDISKLESGNMKLETIPINLIPLLKALVLSFTSYAERKKLTIKFNSVENEIIVYVDKDKFEKIINNILSNAFKFTPEGGSIEASVSKDENYAVIKISDTGVGIPPEKLSNIFNRFYQVDTSYTREHEGTGIGLSLTKELVDLHKGKIEVESKEGMGSTFTVRIPLGKKHLKPEEICKAKEEYEKEMFEFDYVEKKEERQKVDSDFLENDSLPVLLLVEDNFEVRNYIKDNLIKEFRILEAADGEEGWKISIESPSGGPDLVVSDVMMPKMDGFQLCEKLKTDERTSHIPVILLTAKATKEDKLEGYQLGADEYLMKPFEPDELKARIKNLIEQRRRLHEHFRKEKLPELNDTSISSLDKIFMQKVYDVINDKISDGDFSMDDFAEKLLISKSLLYKKIVSLTGEPPVEFIRRIRLNKAAGLIENDSGNLSEIAMEVGFNNPAYFSECFKKQFGVPPSKYSRNNKTS